MFGRKLRGGMVGGGIGAFIGPVHRMAATMDGHAEFIAGAFSSDPEKSKASGAALFLDPSRVYATYEEMAEKESRLPASQRIDFVSIVTPNASHLNIAHAFLERGINVICDKPMTASLSEAKLLRDAVRKSGKVFALTHNYTGYPMVKQARHMVQSGELGRIIKIIVEYQQGWLSDLLEHPDRMGQIWRLNPEIAGGSCTVADIGTHAENLTRYITGLHIKELCADLTCFIPGSTLDDDASVLLRFDNGAKGILSVSQVSSGEENGLTIRIYGTRAGIEWKQENPNYLTLKKPDGTRIAYSKGNHNLCQEAVNAARLPPGHPDGFIEGFANVYIEAYKAIEAQNKGMTLEETDYPNVDDGVTGMAFIETVLESAKHENSWVTMKT